ncbi:MAG: hypothetical protein AAFO29_10145 [Actinomycetota bacterium]
MGQIVHLAGRFFGSLRPGPPAPADEAWAIDHLGTGELDLWHRMSNPDRRHAVGVARAVSAQWSDAITGQAPGAEPPREVVAAALLHDVGKVDAGLRTPARVVATVLWAVLDDQKADRWLATEPSDPRSRLARYRRHPEIGGRLLTEAGASPLTVAWAEEHHRPAERWSIDRQVGELLKDCDDD